MLNTTLLPVFNCMIFHQKWFIIGQSGKCELVDKRQFCTSLGFPVQFSRPCLLLLGSWVWNPACSTSELRAEFQQLSPDPPASIRHHPCSAWLFKPSSMGCFAYSRCCVMLLPVIRLSIPASPNHPLHLIDQ